VLTTVAGSGTVGDSVYDTATITFTPATAFAKGGTVTYTFTGSELSGLTVPAGWTAAGLPVGLQIIGPRFADALVLRAAAAFEAVQPWADRRPSLS
jgi:aspartyl-tRNA(Asn)/glutamyl-tRNA(Gln) amidotransferase subunit A